MNSALIGALLLAMAMVESDCNPEKVNPVCGGVGIIQITDIMLDDCNRIVGENRWSSADRFDIIRSYEMAVTYWNHYGFTKPEEMARSWNGGPDGDWQDCTLDYWVKVDAALTNIMRH